MQSLTIRRPDDFHVHFRQDKMLQAVAPFTSKVFARAVAMPNTDPPILTAEDVVRYRAEISDACGKKFEPLMTIYLTAETTPQIIRAAKKAGVVAGKWYPKGVTTGSDSGAGNIGELRPALDEMQEQDMVLSIHGQLPGKDIYWLDREKKFLSVLVQIATRWPQLRIVMEHLSTRVAIDTVLLLGDNVAATITAHHLVLTGNDFADGALYPDNFCIPPAQTEDDRQALLNAATSGKWKFFFGGDSAPHLSPKLKCGIFSEPVALPLLAQIFDGYGVLDRLENFVSRFGADWYGLPRNTGTLTLVKEDWTVPDEYEGIKIFQGGQTLHWKVA